MSLPTLHQVGTGEVAKGRTRTGLPRPPPTGTHGAGLGTTQPVLSCGARMSGAGFLPPSHGQGVPEGCNLMSLAAGVCPVISAGVAERELNPPMGGPRALAWHPQPPRQLRWMERWFLATSSVTHGPEPR